MSTQLTERPSDTAAPGAEPDWARGASATGPSSGTPPPSAGHTRADPGGGRRRWSRRLAVGILSWLALMNLLLAVFNLLPGSPLDGGRVLQAILWRLHGDRTRAALTAARVGQGLGVALIGLGLVGFFFAANLGALWTALIGWFLLGSARSRAHTASLRASLGERRVAEVISPYPVIGPAWFTVDGFLERFAPYHRHPGRAGR
jgi:Peptidase family M50